MGTPSTQILQKTGFCEKQTADNTTEPVQNASQDVVEVLDNNKVDAEL